MDSQISLYNYLNENINNENIEILKSEIEYRIYHYGNQFKYPYKKRLFSDYRYIDRYFRSLMRSKNIANDKSNIISNAYFNLEYELTKSGFNVFSPLWDISPNKFSPYNILSIIKIHKLDNTLKNISINELLSGNISVEIAKAKNILKKYFELYKIRAFITPNDITPFSRIAIDLLKSMNIPTFIFLHGLPARYNIIDENRTDYLMVWGKKIKENYIKKGFSSNKIIVVGHPIYQDVINKKLRFNTDNILLISKSMGGGQSGDNVVLSDRGNLIVYLLKIQRVLETIDVKNVRLRLHPSENEIWYKENIDTKFFILDHLPIFESLKRSSLVIGPTSTVFMDATCNGVTYIIYEPNTNGKDLLNYPLVPPFDGTDKRIVVANSEDELKFILETKESHDLSFINDYISTPFDINIIKDLIS